MKGLFHFFKSGKTNKEGKPSKDHRWEILENKEWFCSSCGKSHFGIMDLGMEKPDAWPYGPDVAKNILHVELKSYISEDFCVVNDEHFFVRCVLNIPIIGTPDEKLRYGVWSSLSKSNFMKYHEIFNHPDPNQSEPWFGWLSNSLKGYPESLEIKCNVFLQKNRLRPLIQLEETDHPLAIEHHQGITLDRIFEIYELNGHRIQLPI